MVFHRIDTLAEHLLGPEPTSAAGSDATTITLIGSGNSAHVCAALFYNNTKGRVRTQLLTSAPEIFEKNSNSVSVRFLGYDEKHTQRGKLHKVSSNPADVIPNADVVLWTGPVYCTRAVFEKIKPFLDVRNTVIGTIFGQGLVHVSATRIFGKGVKFFALRNIPWLCRCVTKGSLAEIVGPKTSIDVAVTSSLRGSSGSDSCQAWLNSTIQPLFCCQAIGKPKEPATNLLPDWTPIVFNPANQIIHPAVYWGHFRRSSNGGPDSIQVIPGHEWLYRDMDEVSGSVLEALDEELQGIKDVFWRKTGAKGCEGVKPLRERLLLQYGDQIKDRSSLGKMVSTNKAYSMAKTPFLPCNIRPKSHGRPHPTHRVVQDDIGWGLCVLLSIAEKLEISEGSGNAANGINLIPRDMMTMCVRWHERVMGKEFLDKEGRLRGKDVGELVLLGKGDDLGVVSGVGI